MPIDKIIIYAPPVKKKQKNNKKLLDEILDPSCINLGTKPFDWPRTGCDDVAAVGFSIF